MAKPMCGTLFYCFCHYWYSWFVCFAQKNACKCYGSGGIKVVKSIKGGRDYWKNEQNAHIPYAEGSERLRKNLLPDSYLDSWICQSLSHCDMRFFTRDVSERMRINSLAAELL